MILFNVALISSDAAASSFLGYLKRNVFRILVLFHLCSLHSCIKRLHFLNTVITSGVIVIMKDAQSQVLLED